MVLERNLARIRSDGKRFESNCKRISPCLFSSSSSSARGSRFARAILLVRSIHRSRRLRLLVLDRSERFHCGIERREIRFIGTFERRGCQKLDGLYRKTPKKRGRRWGCLGSRYNPFRVSRESNPCSCGFDGTRCGSEALSNGGSDFDATRISKDEGHVGQKLQSTHSSTSRWGRSRNSQRYRVGTPSHSKKRGDDVEGRGKSRSSRAT